jgi:hypothetical protein
MLAFSLEDFACHDPSVSFPTFWQSTEEVKKAWTIVSSNALSYQGILITS